MNLFLYNLFLGIILRKLQVNIEVLLATLVAVHVKNKYKNEKNCNFIDRSLNWVQWN